MPVTKGNVRGSVWCVQGLVQSAFLWGYALTPLLGGVLADKYGGECRCPYIACTPSSLHACHLTQSHQDACRRDQELSSSFVQASG